MSKVSLKNFVNIDIQPSIDYRISGTRETITIFTTQTVTANDNVVDSSDYTGNLKSFLDIYFELGGIKANVQPITLTGTDDDETLASAIKELDNKYIVVAFVADDDTNYTGNYTLMKDVAAILNSDNSVYGVNEKILLSRACDSDISTALVLDTDKVKNLVVQYSNKIGAEASIGAYLSQISVYEIDSVKDYMFTEGLSTLVEDVSDSYYNDLMDNNYNVDISLQGTPRACGGNCKDGDSLVNDFVRIILHQTLTDRLVSLLSSKISGATGVGKIYATIIDELKNYRLNGYLSTEKMWTKNTLKVNGVTIIEKGTALIDGYVVKVFPLTAQHIKNKIAPPIYIVIADQYSIRVINIEGEVI